MSFTEKLKKKLTKKLCIIIKTWKNWYEIVEEYYEKSGDVL